MKVVDMGKKSDELRYKAPALLRDIHEYHDTTGVETLVCIYKDKAGVVGIGATESNSAEVIGLIEIAKHQFMDSMYDEE